MPETQLNTDVALGVAIPSRNARGRIARLGPVIDAVLANHLYPPVIERLMAEALVLTALLGSLLKERGGQITVQAQTESGIIDLLVCDYHSGELRGYIRHDPARLADAGPNPSLFALFGSVIAATIWLLIKFLRAFRTPPAGPKRRRDPSVNLNPHHLKRAGQ